MKTGYKEKEKRICVQNENHVANKMNIFSARFETTDFVQERALELETLNSENEHPIILQVEVRKELAKINPKKAPGPDKISGKCLRECSRELAPIVHYLFQQSVDTHTVPCLWKSSCIVPIPKKPRPSQNNDCGPHLPSDEMSRTTSSPAYLHGNVTVSRSSSVCIQAKQEYRRCNSPTCSPCSETPGYTQNFSLYYLLGLFKCVQHYPATYTTTETESHACESIIAQVDLGLSYKQKTVG